MTRRLFHIARRLFTCAFCRKPIRPGEAYMEMADHILRKCQRCVAEGADYAI